MNNANKGALLHVIAQEVNCLALTGSKSSDGSLYHEYKTISYDGNAFNETTPSASEGFARFNIPIDFSMPYDVVFSTGDGQTGLYILLENTGSLDGIVASDAPAVQSIGLAKEDEVVRITQAHLTINN